LKLLPNELTVLLKKIGRKYLTGDLDEDGDPYIWDTSYYVAAIYSGGAPWEEQSSIPKRHIIKGEKNFSRLNLIH
jgi:hypothetical protein